MPAHSGETLPVGAPPLSDEKRPHKIFCVSKKKKKKKKKKRSGTFFLAPPTAFCAPLNQKRVPQIFFSRRPNAKLDRKIHK